VVETVESFSEDRFPKLKDFALKMHLMFGNTYVCESTFSTMKQVKFKNKNQMADDKHWKMVSNLLVQTLVLIEEQ